MVRRFKSLKGKRRGMIFFPGSAENTPSSISSKFKPRSRASLTLAKKCAMHDSNLSYCEVTAKAYQTR
jgi:hypothetical protein